MPARELRGGRTDAEEPFHEEQIIGVLKEAERTGTTVEVIRRHGISRETFQRRAWNKGDKGDKGHKVDKD